MAFSRLFGFSAQASTSSITTLTMVTPTLIPAGSDVVMVTTRATLTGGNNGVASIGAIGGGTWTINKSTSSRAGTYDVGIHTIRVTTDVAANTSFVITFNAPQGARRTAVASVYAGLTGAVELFTPNAATGVDGATSTGTNGASGGTGIATIPGTTLGTTTSAHSLIIGGFGSTGTMDAGTNYVNDGYITTAAGTSDRAALMVHREVTTTGAYDVLATIPTTSSWAGVAISMPITPDAAPVTYRGMVMSKNPYAYYRLGEATGATTATDEVGLHDMTIGTGATLGQPGAIKAEPTATSIFFDGATDELTNFAYALPANPLTIVAFVNQNAAVPSTFSTDIAALNVTSTGHRLRFTSRRNATGTFMGLWDDVNLWRESTKVLPVTQWVQVAVVINGTTAKFYYNGAALNTVTGTAMTGTYVNAIIGAENSTGTNPMKGNLQGVAFFPAALTQTDITDLYNAWQGTGTINIAPTAGTNGDQIGIEPGSVVTLDGSTSTDSGGSIAGYTWAQLSGPVNVVLSGTGAVQTFVMPATLAAGTYTFQLTVTDNQGATDQKVVSITSLLTTERVIRGGVQVPVVYYQVGL